MLNAPAHTTCRPGAVHERTDGEPPKPVVKARPALQPTRAHEGIREWFVREDWLLTDRVAPASSTQEAAPLLGEWQPQLVMFDCDLDGGAMLKLIETKPTGG